MLVLCSHSLLANTVKALGLPPAFPCCSSGLVPSIVNKNNLCMQDKVLNMLHLCNFLVPLQDLESINQSCELLAPLWFAALWKKKMFFQKCLLTLSWASQTGVGSEVSAHSFYNWAHPRQKAPWIVQPEQASPVHAGDGKRNSPRTDHCWVRESTHTPHVSWARF